VKVFENDISRPDKLGMLFCDTAETEHKRFNASVYENWSKNGVCFFDRRNEREFWFVLTGRRDLNTEYIIF
jgi:hypothetical protein